MRHYFYFEPYVFIDVKREAAILFNTLDKRFIETTHAEVMALITSVLYPDHCGVVEVDLEEAPFVINQFIDEVRDKFMGDIIPTHLSEGKPVQLLPQFNILGSDKCKTLPVIYTQENLFVNLREVTLFMEGDCNACCASCSNYHKQFTCCTNFPFNKKLDIKRKAGGI